jgi:hypothetical protein
MPICSIHLRKLSLVILPVTTFLIVLYYVFSPPAKHKESNNYKITYNLE